MGNAHAVIRQAIMPEDTTALHTWKVHLLKPRCLQGGFCTMEYGTDHLKPDLLHSSVEAHETSIALSYSP